MSNARPKIVSTLKVGRSVAGHVLRGAAAPSPARPRGRSSRASPAARTPTAFAPASGSRTPHHPPPSASAAARRAEPTPAPVEPEAPVTPADVAKNVAPKPQARKKPAKKSSPSAKLPPRKPDWTQPAQKPPRRRPGPRAAGSYFSSALESPRIRRATISCWICWVPSKMSRILESRAHFSSSSVSL